MKKNHLRLVKFNPNDYSLAEVLSKQNCSIIEDPVDVGSAFSLYFQWPKNSKSLVLLEDDSWVDCRISYDLDEREPTEIFIELSDPNIVIEQGQKIVVRFEVFRTCYEFKFNEYEVEDNILVCNAPSKLILFKYRRGPRIELLSKESIDILVQGVLFRCELLSISPMSISFETNKIFDSKVGVIKLSHCDIKISIKCSSENKYTGVAQIYNAEEAFSFFNFYREKAFPYLVDKKNFDYEKVRKLYIDYLNQHIPENEHLEILENFDQTWSMIRTDSHIRTLDYIALDSGGGVLGASSLAKAFKHKENEIWCLHQLCAKKLPEEFNKTESLYNWRVDYLSICPDQYKVAFWYVSKSRWLERIYTKFMTLSSSSSLRSVKVVREKTSSLNIDFEMIDGNSELISIGKADRVIFENDKLFGGTNPERWNLGDILNNVVHQETENEPELLRGNIFNTVSKKSILDKYENELEVAPPDRFALFGKESLMDFRSSVEHSIAVTKRKLGQE